MIEQIVTFYIYVYIYLKCLTYAFHQFIFWGPQLIILWGYALALWPVAALGSLRGLCMLGCPNWATCCKVYTQTFGLSLRFSYLLIVVTLRPTARGSVFVRKDFYYFTNLFICLFLGQPGGAQGFLLTLCSI